VIGFHWYRVILQAQQSRPQTLSNSAFITTYLTFELGEFFTQFKYTGSKVKYTFEKAELERI